MHGEKGACVHAYMHARLLVWLWVNAQTPFSFPFNSHSAVSLSLTGAGARRLIRTPREVVVIVVATVVGLWG